MDPWPTLNRNSVLEGRKLQTLEESNGVLKRAQAGDRPAFALIVTEYRNLVYSIAYHFVHNCAIAEEIAQDVFLELFRNLGKIESGKHLVYWLRRSTTNRCIDQSRKLAFRTETPLEAVSEPAVSGEVHDSMLGARLKREVSALPDWQKAVVILRYQEDLDPAEIAETLSIPLNTVKSRLHRAVETLREKMERKPGAQRARIAQQGSTQDVRGASLEPRPFCEGS